MKALKQLFIIVIIFTSISRLSAINDLDELNAQLDTLNQELTRLESLAADRGQIITNLLRGDQGNRQQALALLGENRNDITTRLNLQHRITELEEQIRNF